MKISTFDTFGNEKATNHGINTYYDVFFDGEKLSFVEDNNKEVGIRELSNILNDSDYKVCHNFYGYDGNKLPLLNSHSEGNIDTLLIDCLVSFNRSHHNLKKSIDNTPLEDSNTTFKVLDKNIRNFHGFSNTIKNLLYSLLINYDEYNDFFIFYNQLIGSKLELLGDSDILNNFKELLLDKNIYNEKSLDIVKILLNTNKINRLAISYLVLFIEKGNVMLPDFIFNENKELKNILRETLNKFYGEMAIDFNKNILTHLKNFSGFDNFRGETQLLGVKSTLENKDFLTILSTGGGKSLIYQLPAWLIGKNLGHLTLIITPLKALIKDQIDGLNRKGFNQVQHLSGDQNGIEKDMIYNKIKSGETKILFLTPESLRSEKLLDLFQNRYISRIVVDEAHTLILWGQEFRPDYFFIKYFLQDLEDKNLNEKINLTLLTATATVDVEKGILDYFQDKKIEIIKTKDILKENIKGSVIKIENPNNKLELLIKKIKEIDINNNPTIIFTSRRKTAEDIEKHLSDEGINARYFHAGMFLNDKKEIQEDFINGKLNLIVATKAFGMGIDKENVRYVIHYDLPGNIEDYTQEIGRAGRDGYNSKNIIFYEKKEIADRIKKLNNGGTKYYHIQNFLSSKYLNIKDKKNVLSPRDIAIKSGIKTNKKNWITDVKVLLSFLEQEKFKGINILNRKYDNTYVLFNKIENKIVNDSYKLIESDNFLNKEEKNKAKEMIYQIIEEKRAIDLNNLELNLLDNNSNEEYDFKNINIDKITKKIRSLKILGLGKQNEEIEIVIEAGSLLKDENYRDNKFNIYRKRLNSIENFKEENSKSSFYDKLKNYYLFINQIKENKGKITIKDKALLLKNFEDNSNIGELIINFIFGDNNKYKDKETVDLNNLLKHIQKNYKSNFTISELKESLFFLDRLNILKVRNGLLVFLTRFTLIFDEKIINNKEGFKKYAATDEFKNELIEKLDKYKKVKINKLLALQSIVEILDEKGNDAYKEATLEYFNTALSKFTESFNNKNILENNIQNISNH